MSRVWHVALREFVATVATKGFIVGVLVTPLIVGVTVKVMPALMTHGPPKIEGEVALLDPTGQLGEGVREYLAPEAIAARREGLKTAALERTPEAARKIVANSGAPGPQAALDAILGEVPVLHVVTVDPSAAVDEEKAALLGEPPPGGGRLALVVVHPDAIEPASAGAPYGSYDLFVRAKLDDRIEDEIQAALRRSIIAARAAANGLDRGAIESLTQVPRVRSTTVTAQGEGRTNEVANVLLPAGFMILLFASVLTSGQYLMTTTIEEKSNRLVEVLLSAVSPMQLMAGKVMGQMAVGLVILGLYAGLGISALISFALLGIVDLSLLVYLFVFYLIAFFIVAPLMAAIGAAVNEMREAQTLMTPVMLVLMIPWLLWMPISRDPNSTFATVISFIPPISTFAMLLRMTSTTPPPMWQVWLSIAVGAAAVWGAMWFAAKVFRVGLLMYGKPPNFATLVRWVRMA